jgi:hypothetical protein
MKELKATDLRIGNYVEIRETALLFDDINTSNNYFQISELGKCLTRFNGFSHGEYYKDIKPIELTEEWFLKFGFKSYDTPLGKLFEFRTGGYTWIIDIFGNLHLDYSEYENIAKIQYVHELQNIYLALTGQELEVKF